MTTEQTDPCEGSTSSAYIHQVRLRNDPLFWRQPNVHGVGEGYLLDENGEEWTETRGIAVYVTERVDQSTLRTEDRIPDCIEGVPVRLIEMPQIIIEPEEFDGPND